MQTDFWVLRLQTTPLYTHKIKTMIYLISFFFNDHLAALLQQLFRHCCTGFILMFVQVLFLLGMPIMWRYSRCSGKDLTGKNLLDLSPKGSKKHSPSYKGSIRYNQTMWKTNHKSEEIDASDTPSLLYFRRWFAVLPGVG